MTPPEGLNVFRRGLVRPKTEEAAGLLREGTRPAHADIEWYQFIEPLYQKYFQLFNDLDRTCGVGGDDFEVEEIEIERLPCVCKTLKAYPRDRDVALDEMIDYMWGLCYRAEQAGLPVFLIL